MSGVGHWLIEQLAVGGHVDDLVVVPFCFQFFDHTVHGFDHHHHSGIAAVAVVVYVTAWANSVFPQVVDVYFHKPLFDGASDYGMAEGASQQFGDDAKYVYSHLIYILGAKLALIC